MLDCVITALDYFFQTQDCVMIVDMLEYVPGNLDPTKTMVGGMYRIDMPRWPAGKIALWYSSVCSGSDTYFSVHLTSQTTICYNLLDIWDF